MVMMAPTGRSAGGGTVRTVSSLPVASEPTTTTVAKPRIAPAGTPAAPSNPTAQPAGPTTTAPVAPTPPTATPNTTPPVASPSSPPSPAPPAANTPPSPYQTNDPLAFTPLPDATVTETAGSFLPPDLTAPTPAQSNVAVPQALQAPIPTMAGGTPAYSLTPTNPGTALTNSTITPGPGVDRYAIANDLLSQWDAASQPQFDRQIRDLAQNAAARGQVGSGMTRGSFADAARDYQTQRTNAQRGFLTDALTGSIDDAYKNIGIAQQQQGFEAQQGQNAFTNQVTLQQLADSEQGQFFQQQMAALGFNAQQIQQAFENAYKTQQLSDDETGQAFYRAMQQYILGNQGDPTDLYQWLAQLYALPQNVG
jgi:hypothetical protein